MRVNLGALFSTGHSPETIADWTWDQVAEAAICVQSYHADLAARIMTGKSPTLEEAKKAPPMQPARQAPKRKGAKINPQAAEDTIRGRQESLDEFVRLEQSQKANNSMVGFHQARAPSRDLFKMWQTRQDAFEQSARDAALAEPEETDADPEPDG